MKADDNRSLVARHLLGSLRRSETEKLMRRALEDQALFEELLGIEDVRNAFQDPAFRAGVAAELRARARRPSWTEWLLRGRVRAVWMTAAATAIAVVALIVMRPGPSGNTSSLNVELGSSQAMEEQSVLARLLPQEPRRLEPPPGAPGLSSKEASLAFDRQGDVPVYRRGDAMRIGFQLAQDAAVLVVEEWPDGATLRLFPNRYQSSAQVKARTLVLIPPAGQGPIAVEGPVGTRAVRVMVFPPGTDPLDFRAPWEETRRKAQVVTRRYRVTD
jgi:hypothetical protein